MKFCFMASEALYTKHGKKKAGVQFGGVPFKTYVKELERIQRKMTKVRKRLE